MAKKNTQASPVAAALREAGFIPLPRLWIKAADMPTIHHIANHYADEVKKVRAAVNPEDPFLKQERQRTLQAQLNVEKAKEDPEAAWKAYERLKNQK